MRYVLSDFEWTTINMFCARRANQQKPVQPLAKKYFA
jgi:hypothetical protein